MYIDIHVHNHYDGDGIVILQNLFPNDDEKAGPEQFSSVGLHPWHVDYESWEDNIKLVEKAAKKQNVLAIGEIGLDKSVDVPFTIQMEAFQKQLRIAELYQKPVIIHCVRAYNDIVSMRDKSDQHLPWIIHWFNSSLEIARELIGRNCYLSFGHMLFKENSKASKALGEVAAESIFLETDDAGIGITEIYEKAALLRRTSVHSLADQIKRNFEICFNRKV